MNNNSSNKLQKHEKKNYSGNMFCSKSFFAQFRCCCCCCCLIEPQITQWPVCCFRTKCWVHSVILHFTEMKQKNIEVETKIISQFISLHLHNWRIVCGGATHFFFVSLIFATMIETIFFKFWPNFWWLLFGKWRYTMTIYCGTKEIYVEIK